MTQSKIELKKKNDSWWLTLDGDTKSTLSQAIWVEKVVSRLKDEAFQRLIIDLTQADLIDSWGLRHLLTIRDLLREKQVEIVLKNPQPQLCRLLEIMQFHDLFTIEVDVP